MTMTENATHQPNYPYQINRDKTMTQPTPALRCHDAEACALGQRPCPSPEACCCAPTGASACISGSEKEKAARHYEALAIEASRAPPGNIEPDGFLESHPFGLIFHRGKPSQMQLLCGACPPIYTAAKVQALQSELDEIGAVAACFGADWPDVEGEPEVLRRVKWAARQLKAAQERPPLTDERIREIDDETHFHESPDWPVRFARAIEAETRRKAAL